MQWGIKDGLLNLDHWLGNTSLQKKGPPLVEGRHFSNLIKKPIYLSWAFHCG